MSFLAIDIGNTRLKWALYAQPQAGALPITQGAVFLETIDVLAESASRRDVLLVAVGTFGNLGLDVGSLLEDQGYGATVVDPRWVRPVPPALVSLAAEHRLVVVVEDGIRTGGVGAAVAQLLGDAGVATPVREIGVEPGWHPHGSRAELLADLGLTGPDVARRVTGWISSLDHTAEPIAPL